jgi:hypothetical protein
MRTFGGRGGLDSQCPAWPGTLKMSAAFSVHRELVNVSKACSAALFDGEGMNTRRYIRGHSDPK